MGEYSIKIGVNYRPFRFYYNHTNSKIAMISHFQINGIYVYQYFNIKTNFDSILQDIQEFVRYLKKEWSDYDWVWTEPWEGYNLNSESKLILDIFNIAFNYLNVSHSKLWFYIGNHLQVPLYGFNYVRIWPYAISTPPEYDSNIDYRIEKNIYIQGGRTTEFRSMLYDKLNSNNLLNTDLITHTLTLNDSSEGGGKIIPWDDLYKLIDSTFLYVICETDYNSSPSIIRDYVHFTEKTLIPLNQYKPFLMLGGPYYLKYLKKLGFKTFENFWDESYDDEIDNETRMNMVIELIKDFNTKSISELEQLKNDIKPILLHNKNQYTYLNNNPLIYV